MKLNFLQGRVIRIHDSLYPLDLWLENIPIESKAVGGSLVGRPVNLATETVDWIHLVVVVAVQDLHDLANSHRIVILPGLIAAIMQRMGIICLPVRPGEINGNMALYLTATENIVKECVSLVNF